MESTGRTSVINSCWNVPLTPKPPYCSTPALGMLIIVLGCGPCFVGLAGAGGLGGSTGGATAELGPVVGSP